jgi:hypothetical protein
LLCSILRNRVGVWIPRYDVVKKKAPSFEA